MKKFRHELKYYITEKDYLILRNKIGVLLKQDDHSIDQQGYLIRSLYFDNIHDHDLFQKNYGILRRKKFRIRIYNHSDEVIKLEKKSRQGEYILKTSVSISKEEYLKLLDWDYEFLRNKEQPLYKEFYHYLNSEYMRPRVIVDYIREAYIGHISNVRITFDKELSVVTNSTDLFNPNNSSTEVLPSSQMILEVKYDEFLPEYIRAVLQLGAHNRSAISKYVLCRMKSIQYHGY
ncbi:polyphosphate polymerase domain-containing protein [Metabacillus litoralis]|uniref:Polyphosphate polymerase domain-containing protein n=1 Tax=Metabacillus litoralis TaxID=152268 RepID=A0A5C6VA24_9BACI|nr:polyphosphate polymerase domain-containing protein [Metabacillus litoralis]TXC81594.1 polyphosphate polymerase domain-containing protein [Metabacillus litoralis]